MQPKTAVILLWLVFLLGFGIRLYFFIGFGITDQESYFSLRQVSSIRQNYTPLYEDPLSFGGKFMPHMPGFYYLLAGAAALHPLGMVVLMSILPSLLAFVAYFFAGEITSNPGLRLLSAFLAAFNPGFFAMSANSLNPAVLTVGLFFITAWLFLRLEKTKQRLFRLILAGALLVFVSP
jgi:4-amino-4-deoxy-L-arabinose transferase-like glycosyltransferase